MLLEGGRIAALIWRMPVDFAKVEDIDV